MFCKAHDVAAEPLIMDNGQDLVEMVVTAFETPDDEVSEDDSGHDYSTRPLNW